MILAHHEVPVSQTLPESRLYTFIDEPREYALYFLEGQKLIQDLALVHPIQGSGFAYFREMVLSVQPMIALLKGGEQLGFYLDSDQPDLMVRCCNGEHGDLISRRWLVRLRPGLLRQRGESTMLNSLRLKRIRQTIFEVVV